MFHQNIIRQVFLRACLFFAFIAIAEGCRQAPPNIAAPIKMLPSPADTSSAEPHLFTAPDGRVYLSWLESRGDSSFLKFSMLKDNVWNKPITVASGTQWFENWADFPAISVGDSGRMVAHYLQKSDSGKYTYDVMVTLSEDGGASWSAPQILHNDGMQAEHGFVTILPYKSNFFVSWLDGRNTVSPGEMPAGHDHHSMTGGAMTLRGAILSPKGKKLEEWELDNRVCDCCQTTAAITPNGPAVVYRNRSETEVRDMGIVRQVNGKWTAPAILFAQNWVIKGCPVNGPKMEARQNNVAVAWFSAPADTASVHVIFSDNGGKNFGKPVRVDGGNAVGRVDVTWLDDHHVAVSWMENDDIRLVVVKNDGTMGEPRTIAGTSSKRASGFPQITCSGNQLLFGWTDIELHRVQTASLNWK